MSNFWSLVTIGEMDECWEWRGYRVASGYGQYGRGTRAHRVAYELTFGEIPSGKQLDHLCRNRACVNPHHLEPVTSRENTQRGQAGHARGQQMLAREFCPEGHEYAGENLYVDPRGYRGCRTCRRRQAKASRGRSTNG